MRDFSKMSIGDLWNYIEDVDYEASILNVSTISLLEKYKISQKIPKDIFVILNNTLQEMKRRNIKCNGIQITPYEASESTSKGIDFAIPLDEAIKTRSFKEMCALINEYVDWEITRVGKYGTYFENLQRNGDIISCDVKKGIIFLIEKDQAVFTYEFGKDFTHILHIEQEGIYLLKQVEDKLEGVVKFR